jgi:SAM-dependent methyltransferase
MHSSVSAADAYASKIDSYFRHARSEIVPLVPHGAQRVLEIGCGAGATLAMLKARGLAGWTAGVELTPGAAAVARGVVDEVYEGSIEAIELPIADGSLDVVLCLDVLEHLVDPWAVVRRVQRLVRPGGAIIASIPNVRHESVLRGLVWRGEWTYTDEGLLDRTHLRFFTRASAVALMESAGARLSGVAVTGIVPGSKRWWADRLTFGWFRDVLAFQYLIRVTVPG